MCQQQLNNLQMLFVLCMVKGGKTLSISTLKIGTMSYEHSRDISKPKRTCKHQWSEASSI
jgi:hypothetical protein